MKYIAGCVVLLACVLFELTRLEGGVPRRDRGNADTVSSAKDSIVSFKNDVAPIILKYCLPCHAEDEYNPSELSLDTYKDLMEGGKHGKPVIPGDAQGSMLVKKLGADPPFGHPMPLKKRNDPEQKYLPADLIQTMSRWIDQGGKDN